MFKILMFESAVFITFLVLCGCGSGVISGTDRSSRTVQAFPLAQVELLDGPFEHATKLNEQSLLRYEPDRLLARFRIQVGLEPRADAYGGWEGQSLAGHSLGHHLSGCALVYQSTGNEAFKERVQYIVGELAEVQKITGGYLAAFDNGKKIFEEEVAKGNIRSQSFDLNGIWSPFYTHHKVMAGLRDAYRLLGIEQALEIEKSFADWIGTIVKDLTDDQVQEMLNTEFGGIQETLADLYTDTGEKKYLDLARVFHHRVIIDSLAAGKDILPGIHGNTQIPKLIASSRLHEISGDPNDRIPAEFFWDRVVHHHSYVTGGHGNHEYFGAPDQLRNRLSSGTTETCNVYNMLKLSGHLFQWEPRAEVADFYERALFNHILSAQHPETGRVIYNLSLEMGGHKTYQDPEWFTCCVGSAMETHSKYGGNIYYHNADELYVSQYIASKVGWEQRQVVVTQNTRYPEEQQAEFVFSMVKPQKFTFYLRYPHWAEKGVEIGINGKPQKVAGTPGTYLTINRQWQDGDHVTIQLPFSLRLESMPDDQDRVAVFYGPLVLAGELGPVEDEKAKNDDYVPVWMSESRIPSEWLEPVANEVNTFTTAGIGNPREVILSPFYKMHDRRYSVYFDLFNQEKLKERQLAMKADEERKNRLEEMTYDAFQPGDTKAEEEHHFTGDKLNRMNDFRGRSARGSERGGWLAFDMKVMKGQPMALVIEYWGGFTGSKTFDILVNDEKIATENISGKKDGSFIDVEYDIPEGLTASNSLVTVKFMPHEGHRSGPFFYARTVKR